MNQNYKFIKAYQTDDKLRASFNTLAENTFGLNFENWYQNGFWQEKYIPYSIVDGDRVVANISVNLMDFTCNGELKHYIQLGTVMTDEDYRHKGLSRKLMEIILEEYKSKDGIFLYANDSVLDFYPKFGFTPVNEVLYSSKVEISHDERIIRVPMENKNNWIKFLDEKNKRVSQNLIRMHNDELLMFYLSQFMKETVYYIEEIDTYVIAEVEDHVLYLYDVFAPKEIELSKVIEAFGSKINEVIYEFTPKDTSHLIEWDEKDCNTIFILGDQLKQDLTNFKRFPELAHA